MIARPVWFASVLLMLSGMAHAHTGSSSFIALREQGDGVLSAEMDFALRDLSQLVPLDTDLDGSVTWAEVEQAQSAIESAVLARARITAPGETCTPSFAHPLAIAQHGDGPYARLSFSFDCSTSAVLMSDSSPPLRSASGSEEGQGGGLLALDMSGWFAFDANHRALLEYTSKNAATEQTILTERQQQWHPALSRPHRVAEFLVEGTRHLLTGYDHLAFLGVLLLGLVRRRDVNTAVTLSTSIKGALGVITAFTAAHSLTLGLASTGHLTLPSQPVEIAIAASVLCAALLNLPRQSAGHGWKLAFAFGLVHGLGFAGALAELAGEKLDWLALAAFNIGIELAQIVIAAILLPMLCWLFRGARTERVGVPVMTCSVAGLALVWVAERTLV
ncbi:MAG: HupE/UreJ family protein [Steroidobacteraceae bacterium]